MQLDAVITGNLTVNGNTTLVNSNVVTINDKFINVANNAATAAQANGGGLGVGPVGGEYATLTYNSTNNDWNTNIALSVNGNVSGSNFVGNGQYLTSITGANVTGSVAQANTANIANSVSGSNVSGQVANALVAGTVYTNAQPNITSVGTLTSVAVTGNTTTGNLLTGGVVSATGNVTGNYLLGNGAFISGLPAGYSNADVATFLANFGSNSISTTGNVTAGNFFGNGSGLTSITGANVTGTVANATFATTAGSAGTANTAVTVTGNAQANITSVGVLTSLSVSGNINGSNINASTVQATTSAGLALKNLGGTTQASMGAGGGDNFTIAVSTNMSGANAQIDISPTGNSGHVHIKPTGTPSVEIAPIYTGSINNMVIGNVTPAAVSGTTVSATGNITGNYFIGNGSQLTGLPAGYSNADVATFLANFGSNSISTTGNVTANYFIGNGSQLTGITATANAAGSNTQIQFNNAGAFAGNVLMTFDNTTANVTLSNLIIGTNSVGNIAAGNAATRINTSDAFSGVSLATNGLMPGQIVIGNGFFGNLDYRNIQARPTAKFVVWDSANVVEAAGNSIRYQAGSLATQISISNIASTSSIVRGGSGIMAIGGGPSANSWTATGQGMSAVLGFNQFLAVGQPNTVAALGNVTLTGGAATFGQHFIYAGSNVGNAGGVLAQISAAGNVTSGVGFQINYSGTPSTTPTNTIGYYMPGIFNRFGSTNSNGFRQATNYYFLQNDDDVAQNQLGSLRAYHTFQYTGGNTSGTWNISKTNGQVQAVSATGNINIGNYSEFVTTANDGTNNDSQTDTVTLIIEQGATPYTVTVPTGNAAIKYAGNVTTVSSVANTTTMIAITAYRTAANTTGYLTTISPGFV